LKLDIFNADCFESKNKLNPKKASASKNTAPPATFHQDINVVVVLFKNKILKSKNEINK
jgi:hypothetical protein